jgi:hypothetical protein
MTTAARALSVASVHLASINASRKKCGLALLTATELAREFADADRAPIRTKGAVQRPTPETDALWGGIVARLNATLPSNRPPIGSSGERSSAASGGRPTQTAVNWASIASELNEQAGLATPVRSRAR